MRSSGAPVEVEVLGEERRRDEPRAVVHEALRRGAAASPRRRAGTRSARPSTRRAPRRRRASGRLADACPRARSPAARRRAGSGSRASRAAARTRRRPGRSTAARRPRAARHTRSAGTAESRDVESSARSSRRLPYHASTLSSHASSRRRPRSTRHPAEGSATERSAVTSPSSGISSRIGAGGEPNPLRRFGTCARRAAPAPPVPVRREDGKVISSTRRSDDRLAGSTVRPGEDPNVETGVAERAAPGDSCIARSRRSATNRASAPTSAADFRTSLLSVSTPHDERASCARARASRSRSDSSRNATRFGAPNRSSTASSSTNSGTTSLELARTPRAAPDCRGRRRSRVKRTIATRIEPTLATAVRYDDEQAELGGRHGSSGDD